MPGRQWSPAWVTWAHGSDYIGWCPQGRGDRPVTYGAQASPWTYTRRGDLGARDLARRRVDVSEREVQGLRIVDRGHIDRSLQVVEGGRAVPRAVQTRPSPGDTTPELRADPMTTIPFPVARRRYASEDERRERESQQGQQRPRTRFDQQPSPAPSDGQARRKDPEGEVRTPERERQPFSWIDRRRAGERTPDSSPTPETRRERERAQEPERAVGRERDSSDQERDVLRRVFRPLSEAGGRERGGESSSRDSGSRDSGERARSHTRETPRESPSPRVERRESPPRGEASGGGGGGARRKKDPDR
jgi:hypothetical protein